jgi:hypothetical protein
MFEHLATYNTILVTGPQRSGSRIAAKMVAADTGHTYVDETQFGVYNLRDFAILLRGRGIVVQCPTMSHVIHGVSQDHGTLVVFMMRDVDDIANSEERVKWDRGVYIELAHFGYHGRRAKSYRLSGGQVAPLKYKRWEMWQKDLVWHHLELQYESLAGHPLWVPKEDRLYWTPEQTAND